jgi:hypothetical protein
MSTVFGHEWKKNEKGTANQVHERLGAVTQRDGYTFDNKNREYQSLVWHHAPLHFLVGCAAGGDVHLGRMVLQSRRLSAERDLMTKKLGDKEQAELFHNVYVYKKTVYKKVGNVVRGRGFEMVEVQAHEEDWVEMHVDFLTQADRKAYYPFWGGAISVRCDLTRVRHLELLCCP